MFRSIKGTLNMTIKAEPYLWFKSKSTFDVFMSIITSAPCIGLLALFNFLLFHKFIIHQLGPSIMTTVLILIGVLQGCTFNGGGGVILLVLVKILREKSKSPK